MAVGQCVGVFYANNVMFGSRNLEWLQEDINVLVGILRRVRLMENVAQSNTMTCHQEAISMIMSEEAFILRSKGEGDNSRECLRRQIP